MSFESGAGPLWSRSGFSLIEVLVSLLLLSLGVLGLAAAQLVSLENNRSAHFRSQAIAIAAEILDAMRANPAAAAAYVGVYPDDFAGAGAGPALPDACSGPGGCAPLQLAQVDTWRIARYFRRDPAGAAVDGPAVPEGRADVRTAAAAGQFQVRVSWAERVFSGSSAATPRAGARAFVELTAEILP